MAGVVGEELRKRLPARGAQAAMAKALDELPQTVSKWFKGETVPDREKWPAIDAYVGWGDGYIRALVDTGGDAIIEQLAAMGARLVALEDRLAALEQQRVSRKR